jgi:SAM-dependent methyltransferase
MTLAVGGSTDAAAAERRRIRAEYGRRAREVDSERYAPWQPAAILERNGRTRAAATLLRSLGRFPRAGSPCLEIGYGCAGWFPDLLGWGVCETDLHGIELDRERAHTARRLLPSADLRGGDATALPWDDKTFALVVLSTVFSSILDLRVRLAVAREATRVTAPGGAILCYDLASNNPSNPNVRRVDRAEWRRLFPKTRPAFRSVTLAPPLARLIAPRSWLAAQALEAVPWLRTHLLVVFSKP